MWKCRCACGNHITVVGYSLSAGDTKSCGCLQKEVTSKIGIANTKFFGPTEQRIADVYEGMKKRCYKSNHPSYHNYGGRGITICDEWLKDKRSFVDWSIKNGYRRGLSIDRIDNDGPYSPDNCRWATNATQHSNRRDNRIITIGGTSRTVSEWANRYHLDRFVLYRKSNEDIKTLICQTGGLNVNI